jgi:protein MpaA
VNHRAHDYRHLVQRWRAVARAARIRLAPFARADDFEHYFLETPALAEGAGFYISAGIHGDEAGATEGLIAWAENLGPALRDLPLLLLPCLNPWGLQNNSRFNGRGIDLNRMFHRRRVPVVRELQTLLRGRTFDAAIQLHEDYDGQGIYLYEAQEHPPFWGETLIAHVSSILPPDPRRKIDHTIGRSGVIRRRFDPARQEKLGGLPEAIYLQQHHALRSLTIETPSEFALERRIAAHGAVLDACIELARAGL